MVNMFRLPLDLVERGTSVENLHRYIALTGEYGEGDVEEYVHLRQKPIIERLIYQLDRKRKDGGYISISGNSLFSGGYYFTFTDISHQKRYEDKLKENVSNQTEILKISNRNLQRMADIDPLLNIWNRRKFFELVHSSVQFQNKPSSIMMIDVDNFKKLNDEFGHLLGDIALKTISSCLSDCLLPDDVHARFGGEEFVVFLPETTVIHAESIAREMLHRVSTTSIFDTGLYCTVSIGLTLCVEALSKIDWALNRADTALYIAKRSGKNCLVKK